MALVILRDAWFAANGVLYRKSATRRGPPVDIPDNVIFDSEGKSRLPSSAEIVDSGYVTPEPTRINVDTLSEYSKMLTANDPARAAAESHAKVVAEADQTLAENAAKHQADLAAEEAAKPKKGRKGKTHA